MRKKILGLTVALLLIITGAICAQELKFDGYINSGVGVVVTDNKDVDPVLKAAAVDAEHQGYRFRLNGSYTNEAKNAGARFRFQSQTNLSTQGSASTSIGDDGKASTTLGLPGGAGYFSLPYVFGWVSFFNNVITLNAGIVEDSTWSTGDWWLSSDSVSHFVGLGTLLKIAPIDGLTLGVGGYAINRRGGSNNNTLNIYDLNSPVKLGDAKLTFHGAYTMKDMFRVGASFRTENKAGNPNAASSESSLLYGEFRFLGMKDLTAIVAARVDNFGSDFDTRGNIVLSETFGYKLDSLNLGLNAVQFLYNRSNSVSPSMLFNLWGSYALGNIVPRLDLVYFMNGTGQLVTGGNNWFRHSFSNREYTNADNNLSVISARPSVKFNLDSRTFLEIGDMINYDFGKKGGAYADSGNTNKKSRISNAFYIDLKWSF